jgi:hypothetical protein
VRPWERNDGEIFQKVEQKDERWKRKENKTRESV